MKGSLNAAMVGCQLDDVMQDQRRAHKDYWGIAKEIEVSTFPLKSNLVGHPGKQEGHVPHRPSCSYSIQGVIEKILVGRGGGGGGGGKTICRAPGLAKSSN